MKKLLIITLTIALASFIGSASAQMSSSKVTAGVRGIALVEKYTAGASGWQPIFTQKFKTPEQKDLFIDVSLEVGLTTDTKVMSRKLQRALAEAEAMVMVKVLVDGDEALPGEVTFSRRKQTMIAQFAGDIYDCFYTDPESDALMMYEDDACIQPESLQLILDTMAAHSFNFLRANLSSGEHTIEVQAKIEYNTNLEGAIDGEEPGTGTDAIAFASAYIGKGTVVVDCVRMVKGEIPELN